MDAQQPQPAGKMFRRAKSRFPCWAQPRGFCIPNVLLFHSTHAFAAFSWTVSTNTLLSDEEVTDECTAFAAALSITF